MSLAYIIHHYQMNHFLLTLLFCLFYLLPEMAPGQILHSSVDPLLKWNKNDSVHSVHSSTAPATWMHSIDTLHSNSSAAGSLKEPTIPGSEEHKRIKEESAEKKHNAKGETLYETGKATYYSAKMHGRKMADGVPYDKNALYCAHKKLPFGTKVRVVNLKNNREVIVTVHDRGPFGKGMIIDLSTKAAETLNMISAGVVPVEIYVVEE